MGLFDPIGDAFNKAKNTATSILDTGRDKLQDVTRFSGRVAHSTASTFYHEYNDAKNLVSKAKNKVVNTARHEWNDSKRLVSRAKNSVVNTARHEWNDSKRLVSRAKNSVVNTARHEWNDSKRLVSRAKDSVVNTARHEWNDSKRLVSRAKDSVVNTARHEWNDSKRLVSRAKDSVVSTVDKGTNLIEDTGKWTVDKAKTTGNFVKDHAEDFGHGALDAAGFIPVVGAVPDLISAGWYLAEGDKLNAGLSAASAIPFAGDAFAAGKLGLKAAKGVEKLAEAEKLAKVADNGGSKTYITYTLRDGDGVVRYVGRASGKGSPEAVLDRRINGWKGHHILRKHPDLDPRNARVDAVQGNEAANKGAEDVLYSRHQVKLEPGERLIVSKRRPVAKLKPEPGETLPVKARELAGGANTNQGARPLLNRTNPQSNDPRKIRKPFPEQGGYSTPRPDGKMSVFEMIEAYARDLKEP